MRLPSRWCLTLTVALAAAPALAAPPAVTDDRLVLEQVAREPDVVTPTGLSVDEQGRVWVIENHTHQRGPGYTGPGSDRIRILSDLDAAGRARQATTFADGFKDAMSLAFGPNGKLYLATRSEIFYLRREGDRLVERRSLARLVTGGSYPHNGLCGFAFDATGRMVFGMGENLGADYVLVGSDGTKLPGGGEGGNLFTCRPDGTKLTRIATGFWNPYHHTFDAFGRLFVVDNDPDSRGPCRLLHVIPGADFGYRFRYGRRGTHPFQCWDGELAGTLGMVAGTGEAPGGVLAYEAANLPADYRGDLLVTSWGDHTIERYTLLPAGASFKAKMATVVRGGDDFRPVAIATGPDGTVYFSDWVDKSYPVHGKGRVWRLRAKKPALPDDGLRPSAVAALPVRRQVALLGHPRQEVRSAATRALAAGGMESRPLLKSALNRTGDLRPRLHALWAAALRGDAELLAVARRAAEPELRAEAVRLGEAAAAADALRDPSPAVRLQAILRGPAAEQLVPFLGDADPFLVSAAVHVLGRADQIDRLGKVAEHADPRRRLGALLALRQSGSKKGQDLLATFLGDADPEVRRAALRWAGEERLKRFAAQLEPAATLAPTSPALFQAMLAAGHLIGGGKPDGESIHESHLVRVLGDGKRPVSFRVVALRLLRADHPAVSVERLGALLADGAPELRRAAARALVRRGPAAEAPLLRLANDAAAPVELRAEAVLGLASSTSAPARQALLTLVAHPRLGRDALRSLRGAARDADLARTLLARWDRLSFPEAELPEMAAQMLLALEGAGEGVSAERLARLRRQAARQPANEAEWQAYLTQGGDVAAGERVFFHPAGPACSRCHRVEGSGETIGPELTTIGQALTRSRLVESILQPSKEVAPRYVSWRIVTEDGKVRIGVITDENADSILTLADGEGKLHRIHRKTVEERAALTPSIMPDKLHERMTPQEFRDLIAYLVARRADGGATTGSR